MAIHTQQDGQNKTVINVSENVEELQPSYIVGGTLKWCSHFGKHPDSSSKVKCRVNM